nr:phosphoribosylglycinamide synthetase [Sphingomonas flavalba]
MNPITSSLISDETKHSLRVMLVAKHALWQGGLHPEDGNHAPYHAEIREVLRGMGLQLTVADSYAALFGTPDVDFVFPLLNRGGFLNSEMLLPLLCTRAGIPFLGASPILRGLGDDKHLAKLEAQARGVPTAPWVLYRRGAPVREGACPMSARMVVKPNASSASWGVRDADSWAGVKAAVEAIHAEGHDAIVEPFVAGSDIEVPVILQGGVPVILPMMQFAQADPTLLRTYDEKRDLAEGGQRYETVAYEDARWQPRVAELTRWMAEVFHPFDYGRFEFRYDVERDEMLFMEVNLNCNLWSKKAFAGSAALAGLSHAELIETILAESLLRQGLMARDQALAA